jgi:Leucine-rich repeat (LRR) protein
MKLLLIIKFVLFSLVIFSQDIVDVPDPNFKQSLIESGVDINGDGEIQVSEAEAKTYLSVGNKNINSIIGINSFVNLTYLSCTNNPIDTLELVGLWY